MNTFLLADRSLFLLINHLPHLFVLDSFAQLLSGIGQWGLVWFVIAVLLFFREEKRDHWFFAPFIFSGIMSWLLSEVVIKWIVARPRPTILIGAIIKTHMGDYSFPSTHATLAWAMAVILSREEPRLKYWFYTLAVLISLSRIYLGVHYPSDVVGGALLGWAIGYGAMRLEGFSRLHRRKRRKS